MKLRYVAVMGRAVTRRGAGGLRRIPAANPTYPTRFQARVLFPLCVFFGGPGHPPLMPDTVTNPW